MDTLLNDIRFALRSLGKSKMFTAVAVVSLALGIGANVTVFSVVSALAFQPLPYAQPERLVDLHEWSATRLCGGCGVGTSYPGFIDWRDHVHSVSRMGAYTEHGYAISGTEAAERVSGAIVSAGTFDMLGVHPLLGREFSDEEDRVGGAPVVMLSHALWTRRYGADRRLVGQTIRVNGVPHTVIGIMPPGFGFPEYAEMWLPFVPNAAGGGRDSRDYDVVARLRDGISVEQAEAEMKVIAKSLADRYPETQKEWTAGASSLRKQMRAMPESVYWAFLGAIGFVLLIVCANIAGLMLARGAKRQREIAIRLAMGATRRRIVRALLTESLILSIGGGALGLIAAMWGVDLAVKAIGRQAPFYIHFGLDGLSLAFCLGVSILTGVLFGLFPALGTSRPDVNRTLKESSVTVKRSAVRGLLVIAELAMAMVLLAGAGLLTKSFLRISAPEQGYDDSNLLSGMLQFLDVRYRDPAQLGAAQTAIAERIAAIPGVAASTIDRAEFIAGFGQGDKKIQAEGVTDVPVGVSPRFYHVVAPGYFRAVELPVLAGRAFDDRDRAGTERVVMINKRMAEALWPGVSPIGRRIKLGPDDSLPWLTVVGLVGDVGGGDRAGSQQRNYAYVPATQKAGAEVTLFIRAARAPLTLANAVRGAVRAVDPDLPVLGLSTVEQQRRGNYWPYELNAIAMSLFAAFAILLAAVGLYGVIAYNTAQRTREIGVRMALGAEAKHVIAMVVGQGGRLVAIGVLVGAAGSALLLRALDVMLFGASPVDPPIYASVAGVLVLVSLAAAWVPARRAARISPLEALRAE
jgi:putative ABC transport system permease protein